MAARHSYPHPKSHHTPIRFSPFRKDNNASQDNSKYLSKAGNMADSLFAKSVRIGFVVGAYWIISISMVFINKYLLSSPDLKLDAPLFVTWFQCVVCLLLCAILGTLGKYFPHLITFPEFKIDPKVVREVLPVSIVFVAMITCNNLCLKYVGVAFYFIGRSLTTVFNVVFSYIILKQTTSCKAIVCCGIIIFGFLLGVDQENVAGSLSWSGVGFGLAGSASVALYSIYTKKCLPLVDNNVWRLALYNNFNATIMFLPLIAIFGEIKQLVYFPSMYSSYFWFAMSVGGVFGFGIGFISALQIQVTSPLTHNISGTAKACAQTVIATFYYHDIKPSLWWFSNFVILFGSGAYTQVKHSEMKTKHEEAIKVEEKVADLEKITINKEKDQLEK